jgi:hypothetical protein
VPEPVLRQGDVLVAPVHETVAKPLLERRDCQERELSPDRLEDGGRVAHEHECVGLVELRDIGVCRNLAGLRDLALKVLFRLWLLANMVAANCSSAHPAAAIATSTAITRSDLLS